MDWNKVAKTLGIGISGFGKTYFPSADKTLKERKLQAKYWDLRYSLLKNMANEFGIDLGEEPKKMNLKSFTNKVLSDNNLAKKYNIPLSQKKENVDNVIDFSTLDNSDKIKKIDINSVDWKSINSKLKNPLYELLSNKKVKIGNYTFNGIDDFLNKINNDEKFNNLLKKYYGVADPKGEINKVIDKALQYSKNIQPQEENNNIMNIIKENPAILSKIKKAYSNYLKDYYKQLKEYRKNIFWKIPDLKTELLLYDRKQKSNTGFKTPSYLLKTNYKDFFNSVNQKFKNLFANVDSIKSSLIDKNLEDSPKVRSVLKKIQNNRNTLFTQANVVNPVFFSKIDNPNYYKQNRDLYLKYIEAVTNAYNYPLRIKTYYDLSQFSSKDITNDVLSNLRNGLIYKGLFENRDKIQSINDMRNILSQLLDNYFTKIFNIDFNNIKDKNFRTVLLNSFSEVKDNLENQYIESLKKIMESKGFATKRINKPTLYDVKGFMTNWLNENGL